MDCCAFIRVSTTNQKILNQRKIVEEYCIKNNLNIIKYLEIKGTGFRVPYIKKLPSYLKKICNNGCENIVVYSVDRLSKSIIAFIELLNVLPKKVKIHFILEKIVIEVSEFFPANIKACEIFNAINVGQNVSSILSFKIKQTRKCIEKKGGFLGGRIPFGKMLVQKDGYKKCIQIPELKNIVKLINWLINKYKVKKDNIISLLNNRNIYMPFWRKDEINYACWNKKLIKKTYDLYPNLGVVHSKPEEFKDITFDFINIENTLEEDNSYEYIKILDEAKLFGENYCKILWKNPLINGQPNISWIPESNINN